MKHPDPTAKPALRDAAPLPGRSARNRSGVHPASSFAVAGGFWPRKTGLAILLTGFVWSCAALSAGVFKPPQEPAPIACALALP